MNTRGAMYCDLIQKDLRHSILQLTKVYVVGNPPITRSAVAAVFIVSGGSVSWKALPRFEWFERSELRKQFGPREPLSRRISFAPKAREESCLRTREHQHRRKLWTVQVSQPCGHRRSSSQPMTGEA